MIGVLKRFQEQHHKTVWLWGKEPARRVDEFKTPAVAVPLEEIHRLNRIYPIITLSEERPHILNGSHIRHDGSNLPAGTYIFAIVHDLDGHELPWKDGDYDGLDSRALVYVLFRELTLFLSQNNLKELDPDTVVTFTGRGFNIWFPFPQPLPISVLPFISNLSRNLVRFINSTPILKVDEQVAKDILRPYKNPYSKEWREYPDGWRYQPFVIKNVDPNVSVSFESFVEFTSKKWTWFQSPDSVEYVRQEIGRFHLERKDPHAQVRTREDFETILRNFGERVYSNADGIRHEYFLGFIGELVLMGKDVEEIKGLYEAYLLPYERRDNRKSQIPSTVRRAKERLEAGEPIKRLPYPYRLSYSITEDEYRIEAGEYIQDSKGLKKVKRGSRYDTELLIKGFRLHNVILADQRIYVTFTYLGVRYENVELPPTSAPLPDFASHLSDVFSRKAAAHLREFLDAVIDLNLPIVQRSGRATPYYNETSDGYVIPWDFLLPDFQPDPTHLFGFYDAIRFFQYRNYRTVLAYAFASLLLPVTRPSIYPTLWIYGYSGIGKSTLLRRVAEAFGHNAIISTYGTLVGIERRAAAISPLPLFIDDTALATEDLKKVIFLLASGVSKLRGTRRGGVNFKRFNTLALFTSEIDPESALEQAERGVFRRIYPFALRIEEEELRDYVRTGKGAGWALIYLESLRDLQASFNDGEYFTSLYEDHAKAVHFGHFLLSPLLPPDSHNDIPMLIEEYTQAIQQNTPDIVRDLLDFVAKYHNFFMKVSEEAPNRYTEIKSARGSLYGAVEATTHSYRVMLTPVGLKAFIREHTYPRLEFLRKAAELGILVTHEAGRYSVSKSIAGYRSRWYIFDCRIKEDAEEIPF